jgi:bacillithiol biosynthesis cysteine-adding enzyme BshC
VRSQCLPFTQIPHTTRLFKDFLSWTPEVSNFYPRSPQIKDWLSDQVSSLKYEVERRARVSDVLEKQNRAWNASAKTIQNIEKFRGGAAAMVTGQQVGLFGGPLFAIFKALTAIKLANDAQEMGFNCVPVFWLATIDHDLEEVNQVQLLGAEASFRKFSVPVNAVADAPVGTIAFGSEIETALQGVSEILGDSEAVSLLRETYRPDETFGSAFGRLLLRLFAEHGVIVLNAADPKVQKIALPVYRAAAEQAGQLNAALQERGRELEAGGYHQQVKVTATSSPLFTLRDGARVPVHITDDDFVVVGQKIPRSELIAQIESSPELFSANVLLRPVVQDYLLPTVAYVGGSAEVAYFAQAAVLYKRILGRGTPIFPRFSATIVEPKQQSLLQKYGLSLLDIFQGSESVREKLAKHTLPEELQAAFEQGASTLSKSMARVQAALGRLDKTLVEAAENAGSKIEHQLEQLRARAARAELRHQEVLGRHAELLSNTLYPNKVLQEREISGVYFLAKYGAGLISDLLNAINVECVDHQIVSL